jgi:putative DNA primase/helicase
MRKATMRASLSIDQIRAALDCVPADLPRDEWARIGMALKSELGDAGFELFNSWSARADNYDATATRDTWRSVKAGGRVTIGTLFHLAKQHGFKASEHGTQQPEPSAAEQAAQAATRAQRGQQEQAEREAAQAKAAEQAQRLWDAASETGASDYLRRKGVGGHGVRFTPAGAVLVPMRNLQGELRNVQTIAPERPASGPEKRFLKGGQKSGLLHWLGDPAGAEVLILAEGYATAASVFEATGRPVACCFDASNLPHVARAVRSHFGPGVLLLIAADNDRETESRTGKNPGRIAAEATARKVGGFVALPDAPEGQNVDFNDWAASAGLEAVKDRIEVAIAQALEQRRQPPEQAAEAHAPRADRAGPEHDRFTLNDRGVWFAEVDSEGRPKAPLWVCSRLEVTARTRDVNGGDWGYLLDFDDPAGQPRQWAAPAKMLAADGAEFRGVLLSLGLRISTASRARQLLATYVQSREPAAFARCVDRVGWHSGGVYVLPDEVLGDASERLIFQTEAATENTLRQRGTLAQWRDRVAAYAVGNSRLAFCISISFAGMVLRPSGEGGGGFNLVGPSSGGKSTTLRLAASVYGPAAYAQNWRSTSNAIEGTAAAHCDRTLILDEIAQIDAREVGECAYMLSNGSGKARASRTGQPRPRLSWLLMLLSAGEVGIAQHMASVNKTARAGQELRLVDLPADAGANMGVFEFLHDKDSPQSLAQYLGKAADAFHGCAGRAFLEHIVSRADTLRDHMRSAVDRLADEWVPEAASGQVHRVARRFAVVAAAGELATAAGLTGWPVGEAERAVRRCFEDWLASRGGLGNSEDRQMLAQVRRFLELHGEGRFTDWARADDDHAPRTLSRAGFRKASKDVTGDVQSWDFYVLPETFRQEIAAGFDYKSMLRTLRDKGHLQTDKGRAFDRTVRLPGLGRAVIYHVLPTIFEDADEA